MYRRGQFCKASAASGRGEAITAELPSSASRIAFLLATFALLLPFEAALPLFSYGRDSRLRNIGRNLAITVIFLGVNLVLGPISPLAAKLSMDAGFGLSWWFGLSPVNRFLLGIGGLDLADCSRCRSWASGDSPT